MKISAEASYNMLVDMYLKNIESIQNLQQENAAITQVIKELTNEIHPILESSFPELEETRRIYCNECDYDYEDQINYGKEAVYLQDQNCRYCGHPGHEALTIIDLETDWHYNPLTCEFEEEY